MRPFRPPAAPLFLCIVLYLYVIPNPLCILSFVIPSPLCIPPFVIPNHQGAFFQSAPWCVRDPLASDSPRGDSSSQKLLGMTVGEGDGNKGEAPSLRELPRTPRLKELLKKQPLLPSAALAADASLHEGGIIPSRLYRNDT